MNKMKKKKQKRWLRKRPKDTEKMSPLTLEKTCFRLRIMNIIDVKTEYILIE